MTSVWALYDERVGIANQVIGLTEAVGLPFIEKRCSLRFPWSRLPPSWWAGQVANVLTPGSAALSPPWPDLIVTCGRQGALMALAVKRASGGRSFVVQIQDPRLPRRCFDLMVVPEHDPARGDNVVVTKGAVHRVTREKLEAALARFGDRFASLPRPLVAVMIGGRNKAYEFGLSDLGVLADQLAGLAAATGGGLLVTPSRRTGPEGEALLRERLAGVPAYIWDGSGENPYFAFLALADAIVVTEDSVSMVSEAASTGKPVHIVGLTGKPVHVVGLKGGSRKFGAFHQSLREAGVTRPFTGKLESWSYEPLDDTARAALEIRRRFGEAGKTS